VPARRRAASYVSALTPHRVSGNPVVLAGGGRTGLDRARGARARSASGAWLWSSRLTWRNWLLRPSYFWRFEQNAMPRRDASSSSLAQLRQRSAALACRGTGWAIQRLPVVVPTDRVRPRR